MRRVKHRRATGRHTAHRLLRAVSQFILAAVVVALGLTTLAPTRSGLTTSEAAPLLPPVRLAAAGVPADPVPVFTENFSNQDATLAAIRLTQYTGGAAAYNQTYTAVSQWLPGSNQCNGYIINSLTPVPLYNLGDNCGFNGAMAPTVGYLNQLVNYMGLYQGMTVLAAAGNQALTEYTNSSSGTIAAGTMLSTLSQSVPAVTGHYYLVSAIYGAANCNVAAPHPLVNLFLQVKPAAGTLTESQIGTQLDACTNPGTTYAGGWINVSTLNSTKGILVTAPNSTLGLRLYNAQGSGSGNDGAFDLPRIVDATPTIDKSFSPTLREPNQSSTLTFTITNTSELAEKGDWSFTDTLPSGLKLANTTFGGTCANIAGTAAFTVTGTTGGSTVTVAGGDLARSMTSCTITVNVTSATEGTYKNDPHLTTDPTTPGNMTTLTGLLPGDPGTVTFRSPRITVVKALGSSRLTGASHTNDQFTVALRTGSGSGPIVSTQTNATTTGTGSAITTGTGTTGAYVATSTTTYYPTEAASGTTSLGLYNATLTCIDANGLTANLPNGTPYTGNVGITPAVGAAITCTITNTASAPTLSLTKVIGGSGRVATSDQFSVAIRSGSTAGTIVSSQTNATTLGAGTSVTAGSGTTGTYTGAGATTYYLTEAGAGSTTLANYSAAVTCTDSSGTTAGLPNGTTLGAGLAVTPAAGARITCLLTNTPLPPSINVAKTLSSVTLNPTTGIATATYSVTVTNNSATASTYGPLTDTPSFSSGLAITGATWTSTSPATNGSSATAGPYTLASSGTAIAGNTTHTYTLAVTFTYTGAAVTNVCTGTGTALTNTAALPTGQESGAATDNSICGPLVAVALQKVGPNGTSALAGSSWQLYTNNAGSLGVPVGSPITSTGSTGQFRLDGLVPGTSYFLVETQAPSGYQLLGQPIGFTVSTSGSVSNITGGSSNRTDTATGLAELVVRNYPAPVLPLLGGAGRDLYTVGGIALLTIAAVLLVASSRRRRRHRSR